MARMSLSLDTLKDFDFGKAAVAFEAEMGRIVRDIVDRPGDKTAREVTLQCLITPVLLQEGDVVDANVAFVIKGKVPPRRTAERPTLVSKGRLLFSAEAPDNPRQRTLDEAERHD